MQFKNSMLLMTALTAGSAVARLHGHQRRHEHRSPSKVEVEVKGPSATEAPEFEIEMERRAVGDVVSGTIDGVLQTWINNWSGEVSAETSSSAAAAAAATSTSTSTTETPTPTPTETPTQTPETTATPSAVESSVSPVATSNPSSGSWYETPSSGDYSLEGFGSRTNSSDSGEKDWSYQGNVGSPWGSNIIEVEESKASQYKHIIRFHGSPNEEWTVIFWNTYGPDGKMDGFWKPHKALHFTIGKGETKYVAFDDNSQGGWAAAAGEIPTSNVGQYASTWGEFDMSNEKNDGHSGWDVSSIIAQLASLDVQGMRICDHKGSQCSTIGKGLLGLLNAYTEKDQGNNAKAVKAQPGPIRLVVDLDYSS